MIQPVFYNIFCCFIIALTSAYTSFYIFQKQGFYIFQKQGFSFFQKQKKDKEAISFGFFWLSVALTWVCIGFYTLFLPSINKPFVYAGQVFIAFSFIFLIFYLLYKIWGKIYKWVLFLYFFIDFFYIFSVFYVPFPNPLVTDWGVAFPIPSLVSIPFVLLTGIVLVLGLFDIFKRIFQWIRKKQVYDLYKFFATFSIVLYLFAGFFDEWAIHYGGIRLFLIRIFEMFSALLAYLCYSGEVYEKENFVE
ncbi:MAG: hypothetical protein PHO31_02270 [Candidatus Pacebacteria bacterium]|nr:hypothetical protein [Candidatus Paceibacterota bacterium]